MSGSRKVRKMRSVSRRNGGSAPACAEDNWDVVAMVVGGLRRWISKLWDNCLCYVQVLIGRAKVRAMWKCGTRVYLLLPIDPSVITTFI